MRSLLPLVLGSFLLSSSWATPADSLKAFAEKLDAAPVDTDSSRREYARSVAAQIKALQSALQRGDFEKAQQLLSMVGNYGLPPELQAEWQDLADDLAATILEMQQQAAIDWKKSVDEAASFSREAALKAKTSEDLDEALVRIASLQIKRVNSNNVLIQRAQQKLEGTARFLDQLSRYFDYKAAGDTRGANQVLQDLLRSSGGYPLLSKEDTEKLMMDEPVTPSNYSDAIKVAFRDVKTTADLPAAIKRMQEYANDPIFRSQGTAGWNVDDVLVLEKVDRELAAGHLDDAEATLKKTESSTIIYNTPALASLSATLRSQLTAARIAQITGSPVGPDRSVSVMLKETMDNLLKEEQFAKMAQIMEAVRVVSTGRGAVQPPWSSTDLNAISAYASGRQLENAGDDRAAIIEYRRVITQGQSSKYAPTKQAEAALKHLQETNPDAIKDMDGVVLEELRQMRSDLQRLMTRGRPY